MVTAVGKYLEHYAEPESRGLPRHIRQRRFQQVLVVPCYAESADFIEYLNPTPDSLLVLVANMPDNAPPEKVDRTRSMLAALNAQAPANCLVVDRVNLPVPARMGVGLARKIGADVALRAIAEAVVERPWIYMSDADARLPVNYFSADLLRAAGAAHGTVIFPYRHVSRSPALQSRADLYELHMRHYVRALAVAGSPYAFPTLGSTICVHADAYAKVRGVPRRNAGEDFHLLNKLAKIAPITQLAQPVITLSARLSDRVPFGTGVSIAEISGNPELYTSYAPESFTLLGDVLDHLYRYARTGNWTPPKEGDAWLQKLGWYGFLDKAGQYPPGSNRKRRIDEWFDGLRTLRFVHLARERHPDEPLLAALRRLRGGNPDATTGELLASLRTR